MYIVKKENLKGLKKFTDSIDWDLEYDNLYLSNKFKNENTNKKNKVLDLEKEESTVDFLSDLFKKYIKHINSGGTLFGFKLVLNKEKVFFKCCTCSKKFLHQDISVGFNNNRINVGACFLCNKENHKNWLQNNNGIQKMKDYTCSDVARKNRNDYTKKRLKKDHIFRFKHNVRCLIKGSFKRNGNNWERKTKTELTLGCELIYFKIYIENKFTEGMTFANYGQWHLDHIKPLALSKTREDVMILNHYTNFQPLWAADNFKKGSKY